MESVRKTTYALAEAVGGGVESTDLLLQIAFLPLEVRVATAKVLELLTEAVVYGGQMSNVTLVVFDVALQRL